ncbi:MAG TPA: hypothetical protein VGQ83_42235, partial [Polyangia bacterium]
MPTVDAGSFATTRYEVVRCLGEGGMGVVYEARDRERGLHVALKTLRNLGGAAQSGEAVLRFKNEFRALQHLAEALDRGDLYGATNLRLSFTNLAWLVGDDPAEARRMAEAASRRWSQRGFQVQHWYDLTAQTHLDLYTGD